MTDDSRDRLIALEVEVQHLAGKVDGMQRKVEEMHTLVLQAKGARWVLAGAASIGGGLAYLLTNLPHWPIVPR